MNKWRKMYCYAHRMWDVCSKKCVQLCAAIPALSDRKRKTSVPSPPLTAASAERPRTQDKPVAADSGRLMEQLREFLTERYAFRYNLLTDETEFRPLQPEKDGESSFCPVTQRELNSICIDALNHGIRCWDRDLARYIRSTKIAEYHPFTFYFEELPAWDGTNRLHNLASRVSDAPLWVESFHRWMLALAAQWMGRAVTHANSVALLLVSKEQGRQKSTFCRSLMPPSLARYYTTASTSPARARLSGNFPKWVFSTWMSSIRSPPPKCPS